MKMIQPFGDRVLVKVEAAPHRSCSEQVSPKWKVWQGNDRLAATAVLKKALGWRVCWSSLR